MLISCYSFTEIAQKFLDIINNNGSLLTLSYFGSQKVIPNYNVMGVAKAALETSIKYLAVDLGKKKIRVNCISPAGVYKDHEPGFVNKLCEQIPMGRMAKPEELTGAIIYLCSDASSFVTGHNLVIDGGRTIW